MRLTKENAEFLKIYANLAKGADILKNSVIINVDGSKASFTQYGTDYFALYTEVDIDDKNEKFKVIWNTNEFFSLLEALKYDADITAKGLETSTGHHTLKTFKMKEPEGVEDFFKNPDTMIPVSNLWDITETKDFLGDAQFSYLTIDKDKFISTNKTVGIRDKLDIDPAFIPKMDKYLFIHRDIIKHFIAGNKRKEHEFEIDLYDSMAFWALHDTTYNIKVFLNYKTYGIINFDNPNLADKYNHKEYIILSRDKFYDKLKVMMVMAKSNPNRRVYFAFREGSLVIENRNINPQSSDSVDCKYPDSFEGKSFAVDGGYILLFEPFLDETFRIHIDFAKAPLKFSNGGEEETRLMIYARLKED